MKRILPIILIAVLIASCKTTEKSTCLISGTVKNASEKEVIKLTVGNRTDTLKLNADGAFSQEIMVFKPTEAMVQGSKLYAQLYLVPGKDLSITCDAQDFNKDLVFGGSLAAPNEYILKTNEVSQKNYEALGPAYRSPFKPSDFKRIADSVRQVELDFLNGFTSEKGKLDEAFITRTTTAIQFSYYNLMNNYPTMAGYYNTDKPEIPADWDSFLSGVNIDDPKLLDISEAKYFISSYVQNQAIKSTGIPQQEAYNNPEVGKAVFKYLLENFKNPEFFNLIAFESLKGRIEGEGPFDVQGQINEYQAKSTDEGNKKALKDLVDAWNAVAPGQAAPAFNLPDIDGKMWTLADFAGKYLFIDFWATWCGPCKAEVPDYKKLIADYKSKNIVFMSISVDKDKAAWEKMVKEGLAETDPSTGKPVDPPKMIAMDWLQLHDAVKYSKEWQVRFIPTFVIVDQQGKILKPRALRPSNPELRTYLDALPGI